MLHNSLNICAARKVGARVQRSSRAAFTLVEMLVVVTLIAIVAGIIISLVSGASKDAAETVDISNVKHLTSAIGAYQQLHGGAIPNKLDSLLDASKIAGAAYVAVGTNGAQAVSSPGMVIYIGQDANADGVVDRVDCTSKGIATEAWDGFFRTLTVTPLTASDITYLQGIGLNTVYDFSSNGSLFNGMERYTERVLKEGDPVVTVDPYTVREGVSLYRHLGVHDITDTAKYPADSTGLLDGARGAAMASARFLVFGIGDNTTMLGDRKAGLAAVPQSKILLPGYYNRYMIVIKVGTGPTSQSADFSAILNPMGKSAAGADSWSSRTGN